MAVMVKLQPAAGLIPPVRRQHPAHRILVVAAAGPERGKIVLPRKNRRGPGHGRQVQGRGEPPAVVVVQGRAVRAVEDAVLVGLGPGRFPGVKLRRRLRGL